MQFFRELQLSFRFYWNALRFIERHHLWYLLILPAIFNLILAVLIGILVWNSSSVLVQWIIQHFEFEKGDSNLVNFIEKLLLIGVRTAIVFLYLKIYRYAILIFFAPFMAYISGKVQSIAAPGDKVFCMSGFLADCTRGMRIAFKNFFIELLITVSVLFFSLLIGWLLPIAPLAILVIESYFFGYAMLDYRNEYYDIPQDLSHKIITEHPGLTIGNGLFFNFSLLVPLIGILFAPVIALIAAGLSVNYVEKRKEILCPSNQSTLSMVKS